MKSINWKHRVFVFPWIILILISVIGNIASAEYGRVFDSPRWLSTVQTTLVLIIWLNGVVLCIWLYIRRNNVSISPQGFIVSPTVLIPVALLFAWMTGPFWGKSFFDVLARWSPGEVNQMSGVIVGVNDPNGGTSGELTLSFQLDNEATAHTTTFGELTAAGPLATAYRPDFWRQAHLRFGEDAVFTIKRNVFGRSILWIRPAADHTPTSSK